MGNYYLFKVSIKSNLETKSFIEKTDLEYITYDNYLKEKYLTNVEGNEDYVPLKNNNEIIMILNEDLFDQREVEYVFEVLHNSIYGGKAEYEKSINY